MELISATFTERRNLQEVVPPKPVDGFSALFRSDTVDPTTYLPYHTLL